MRKYYGEIPREPGCNPGLVTLKKASDKKRLSNSALLDKYRASRAKEGSPQAVYNPTTKTYTSTSKKGASDNYSQESYNSELTEKEKFYLDQQAGIAAAVKKRQAQRAAQQAPAPLASKGTTANPLQPRIVNEQTGVVVQQGDLKPDTTKAKNNSVFSGVTVQDKQGNVLASPNNKQLLRDTNLFPTTNTLFPLAAKGSPQTKNLFSESTRKARKAVNKRKNRDNAGIARVQATFGTDPLTGRNELQSPVTGPYSYARQTGAYAASNFANSFFTGPARAADEAVQTAREFKEAPRHTTKRVWNDIKQIPAGLNPKTPQGAANLLVITAPAAPKAVVLGGKATRMISARATPAQGARFRTISARQGGVTGDYFDPRFAPKAPALSERGLLAGKGVEEVTIGTTTVQKTKNVQVVDLDGSLANIPVPLSVSVPKRSRLAQTQLARGDSSLYAARRRAQKSANDALAQSIAEQPSIPAQTAGVAPGQMKLGAPKLDVFQVGKKNGRSRTLVRERIPSRQEVISSSLLKGQKRGGGYQRELLDYPMRRGSSLTLKRGVQDNVLLFDPTGGVASTVFRRNPLANPNKRGPFSRPKGGALGEAKPYNVFGKGRAPRRKPFGLPGTSTGGIGTKDFLFTQSPKSTNPLLFGSSRSTTGLLGGISFSVGRSPRTFQNPKIGVSSKSSLSVGLASSDLSGQRTTQTSSFFSGGGWPGGGTSTSISPPPNPGKTPKPLLPVPFIPSFSSSKNPRKRASPNRGFRYEVDFQTAIMGGRKRRSRRSANNPLAGLERRR